MAEQGSSKEGLPAGHLEARTGEELIQAMQQARKLGLKLRPARVPALVRPPIDFSERPR